jgi:hypothetical protein
MKTVIAILALAAMPALAAELPRAPTPGTECGADGVGYVQRAGDTVPRLVLRTNNGARGYRVDDAGYWQRCTMPTKPPLQCRLSSDAWLTWHDRRNKLTCHAITAIKGPLAHGTTGRAIGLQPRGQERKGGRSDRIGVAEWQCDRGIIVLRRYWCSPSQ